MLRRQGTPMRAHLQLPEYIYIYIYIWPPSQQPLWDGGVTLRVRAHNVYRYVIMYTTCNILMITTVILVIHMVLIISYDACNHMCMCVCMCVYIYIYIYIYIFTHIYTHLYMSCTHVLTCVSRVPTLRLIVCSRVCISLCRHDEFHYYHYYHYYYHQYHH